MRKTYFNSRPSARGDKAYIIKCWKITYFNSRPSARGDALWQGGHAPSPISIHAPPRGATRELIKKYYTSKFQFTPLREGRLNVMLATIYNFISIHAPPRGATSASCREDIPPAISIHAPPRGATRMLPSSSTYSVISIHAPPRGATIKVFLSVPLPLHFNSRPSARGDFPAS